MMSMATSRKYVGPIVAAAVAMIGVTNFVTMALVKAAASGSQGNLFGTVWPILLSSAVALFLVVSFLYRSMSEVVNELQAREAAARQQAMHDQLTGLPNRLLLNDRLEQALRQFRRDGSPPVLLVLDLDRFKQVNDTLGHAGGDMLMQQVAERLRLLVREIDTVARIGGDEFAIIQHGARHQRDIGRFCERIISAIGKPYDLEGQPARVGVSIGVVTPNTPSDDPVQLLRRADTLMYDAKKLGRNRYCIASASPVALVA
jgi:diguanylate cyclase (GGDEF)-like protein